MKKRIIALLMLAVLVLSVFAACESEKPSMLTAEEAQQIALEDAGAPGGTQAHTHFNVVDNVPVFQVHFSIGSQEYEYEIHGITGEILSANR